MRKIGFTLLACSIAALPVAVMAQDSASPDDFVCAFSGDCDEEQAADAQQQPATNANGGRIGDASRGFSLSTTGNQNQRRQPQAQPRRNTGNQVVRNTARTPRRVVASQPGRVNLSINFGVGSAALSSAAQAQVRAFAAALQRPQLSSMRVAIEGHTDASGNRARNVTLSQRRAQSVADYLVSQGVARNRVEVRGYGPDRPLPGRGASNPENRRVEAVRVS